MLKKIRLQILVAVLSFCALILCSCGEKAPPDIIQAADAMHQMITPKNLSRSAFCVAFPDGKPSQFISYLFSTMGKAEWPPSEAWASEMEREQMKSIRQTMLPAGVAIVPRSPDKAKGKQIVMAFDDEKGLVIIKGYTNPTADPVLVREIKLPKVEPSPGVKIIYRNNADLGMTSKSFKGK